MNGLRLQAAARLLARRSASKLDKPRRLFQAFSTYGYADAGSEVPVARSNLNKKSSVEVQLEEAIMRQDDELAPSGVLLALIQGVGTVSGLRDASLNSMVHILDEEGRVVGKGVVLHLQKKRAMVAIVGDASQLALGMDVELVENDLTIPVGDDLIGRVVDPLGKPMDGQAELPETVPRQQCMRAAIPSMMDRGLLKNPWQTGIQVIDCLHPLAYGQRFALLGPRGSGKTRLALDILAQQVLKFKDTPELMPRFVYVATGKPPARVAQIVQLMKDLKILPYCTVVAADDRQPLILQYLAPFAGCTLAESWLKNGTTKNAFVVYDDLSAHTMVVEQLIQSINFQKSVVALRFRPLCLRTHLARKMFQAEALISIVDDHVLLDSSLTQRRVYPPIDCLAPGSSVRGPPFQRAALWKCMQHIRATIIEGHTVHENVTLAKGFGFETEPEDQEVLDARQLVEEFFVQRPFQPVSEDSILLGAFILANHNLLTRLPQKVFIWDVIKQVEAAMPEELKTQLAEHPRNEMWSEALTNQVHAVVSSEIRRGFSSKRR
ncbi:hypothetical protein Ae201684P_021455 [Aphanomyces euteiches]|nr:hypothetical protein Ae201684P_021455 [Aphanomyces euteiches]